MMRWAVRVLCILWTGFCFRPVFLCAEGRTQAGTTQRLFAGTVLTVDILDASRETFTWTGVTAADSSTNPNTNVSITVTAPNGASLGTFVSGSTITPLTGVNGAYTIRMTSVSTGDILSNYDVTVSPAPATPAGRLHSTRWVFDASSFAQANASNASFYAIVDGGDADHTGVVELKLEGVAGFIYQIVANDSGVDGASAGRSVRQVGNVVTPKFEIYLNPPSNATYSVVQPTIEAFLFQGLDQSGKATADTDCNGVVPGSTTGNFTFTSNVRGRYVVICDVNKDGVFDPSSDNDVSLRGAATTGANTATWDGKDNKGSFVRDGTYNCRLTLSVGDYHYVGGDIETSYQGLRLFALDASLTRTGLKMFWNDTDVYGTLNGGNEGDAVTMPGGETPPVTSGAEGIAAGSYSSAAVANTNARAWGNFNTDGTSQGNLTFLDTSAFLASAESTTVVVVTINSNQLDSDKDGITDFDELCTYGSDPNLCDTDGDCLCDGTEVNSTKTDPLKVDSRGDGISDGVVYRSNRDVSAASCETVSAQGGGLPFSSCRVMPTGMPMAWHDFWAVCFGIGWLALLRRRVRR
ncbi:MAG: hypothetical protein HYV03_04330 [Deltaproteobacteria bacterium]|nr:hypothetical protein [Deltaproteobacteria bacterium]